MYHIYTATLPWEILLRGELPSDLFVASVFSPLLLSAGEPHVKVRLDLGHRLAKVGKAFGFLLKVGRSHQLKSVQCLATHTHRQATAVGTEGGWVGVF